jgi:hypothetical protein
MLDARNRYPWHADEDAFLCAAKKRRVPHKVIARELQRSPRAIDQHWAVLQKHRQEELELLAKVRKEALLPEYDR